MIGKELKMEVAVSVFPHNLYMTQFIDTFIGLSKEKKMIKFSQFNVKL